jgi:hypothetical protein
VGHLALRTRLQKHHLTTTPSGTLIASCSSGTAAGADEPITPLATKAISSDWLRVGDSHDVQGSFACPSTGRIHECSRIPHSQHEKISSGYLQEESIHEVLGSAYPDHVALGRRRRN